jgi:hypothetical protein
MRNKILHLNNLWKMHHSKNKGGYLSQAVALS